MKKVKDFNYFITEDARVLNSKGYELTPQLNKDGYYTFNFYSEGKYHHRRRARLLAEAYIPNPENLPVIDHKNGVRTDDSLDNLEWVSHLENNLRSIEKFPERHKKNTSLSYDKIHEICV